MNRMMYYILIVVISALIILPLLCGRWEQLIYETLAAFLAYCVAHALHKNNL